MRKTIALLTPAIYLTFAQSAFAQAIGNPCNSGNSGFNFLCNLSAGNLGGLIGSAINLVFVIAILAALFYLVYGGFRWLVSSGDKSQVAAAREHIVAAIIGLVIIFLAYFVMNLLLSFFGLGTLGNLVIPTLH